MIPFSAERSGHVLEGVTLALVKALNPLAASVEHAPNQQQHSGQRPNSGTKHRSEFEQNSKKDQQKQGDKKEARSKAKLTLVPSSNPPPKLNPRSPPSRPPPQHSENSDDSNQWVGIFSTYQEQSNTTHEYLGRQAYLREAKNNGKSAVFQKGMILNQLVG